MNGLPPPGDLGPSDEAVEEEAASVRALLEVRASSLSKGEGRPELV